MLCTTDPFESGYLHCLTLSYLKVRWYLIFLRVKWIFAQEANVKNPFFSVFIDRPLPEWKSGKPSWWKGEEKSVVRVNDQYKSINIPEEGLIVLETTCCFTRTCVLLPQVTTFINECTKQHRCRDETEETNENLLKTHRKTALTFIHNPKRKWRIRVFV